MLANIADYSERTRSICVRLKHEITADPVFDINSPSYHPNQEVQESAAEIKPRKQRLTQLFVPVNEWRYIGLITWEPHSLSRMISVSELKMIICTGLAMQPFFKRLVEILQKNDFDEFTFSWKGSSVDQSATLARSKSLRQRSSSIDSKSSR